MQAIRLGAFDRSHSHGLPPFPKAARSPSKCLPTGTHASAESYSRPQGHQKEHEARVFLSGLLLTTAQSAISLHKRLRREPELRLLRSGASAEFPRLPAVLLDLLPRACVARGKPRAGGATRASRTSGSTGTWAARHSWPATTTRATGAAPTAARRSVRGSSRRTRVPSPFPRAVRGISPRWTRRRRSCERESTTAVVWVLANKKRRLDGLLLVGAVPFSAMTDPTFHFLGRALARSPV